MRKFLTSKIGSIVNFIEGDYVFILCILAIFIRTLYILYLTESSTYIHSDPAGYDERALAMARGDIPYFPTYWSPFFHIYLSVWYFIFGKFELLDYRVPLFLVFSAILNCFSFYFIYAIAKKIFGKFTAQISLFLIAVWYPLIYMNIFLMSENLFIPLLYFVLYLITVKSQNLRSGCLTGLTLGIIAITRSEFLVFIAMFILWTIVRRFNMSYLIMIFLGLCLTILPMAAYNTIITGGKTTFISSGGGFNFTMAWCDLKSLEYNVDGIKYGFGPPANTNYPEEKRLFTEEEFYNQSYYYDLGIKCIKDNPSIILTNVDSIKNVFYSAMFPTYSSVQGADILVPIFRILNIVVTLFALGIYGYYWIQHNKVTKEIEVLMLCFIAMLIAVYLQNPGEERYLIPYLPMLLIGTAQAMKLFIDFDFKGFAKRKKFF